MKLVKVRVSHGQLGAGFRTPQIQFQVTPFHWALEAMLVTHNVRPEKFAIKVGPLAFVCYFGPAPFELNREAEKTVSSYFVQEAKDKAPSTELHIYDSPE